MPLSRLGCTRLTPPAFERLVGTLVLLLAREMRREIVSATLCIAASTVAEPARLMYATPIVATRDAPRKRMLDAVLSPRDTSWTMVMEQIPSSHRNDTRCRLSATLHEPSAACVCANSADFHPTQHQYRQSVELQDISMLKTLCEFRKHVRMPCSVCKLQTLIKKMHQCSVQKASTPSRGRPR